MPLLERVRAARHKIFEPASAEMNGETVRVHLINVSHDGALLHLGEGVSSGDRIIVRVRDTDLPALIMWAKPPRCGVRFDRPVSSCLLRTILSARSLQN